MVDLLARKVKLELLDPRAPQGPLVQWEDLDPWVLLGCLGSEGALDPAAWLVNVGHLGILANLVRWDPWVSVAPLDIQEPRE